MDLPLDTLSPLVMMKKNGDIEMIHCHEYRQAQKNYSNNLKSNEKEVFRKVDFHFDMLEFSTKKNENAMNIFRHKRTAYFV